MLSQRMSASRARLALSVKFPGGSASDEIARREEALERSGFQGGHEAMQSAVLTELVRELEQQATAGLRSQ